MTETKRREYIEVLQKCLDTKWKDPSPGKRMTRIHGCAACEKYIYNEGSCESCPIGIAIHESCSGTPVERQMLLEDPDLMDIDEWHDMVRDERLFLQALIDHLEAGHDLETFKDITDYNWRKDA